ncbi:Pectin lyase fold/virulence factor [Trinorchestia longiramus]|nr:Pectin lyase fold/virulence factor [Trinorchestia longiramus]
MDQSPIVDIRRLCDDLDQLEDTDTEYCSCNINQTGLSRLLQVKCDFEHKKGALLTSRIYNIRAKGFSSAYVRISNAKKVTVTDSFMREWQEALSSALDIWHSGSVHLVSSPPIARKTSYKTFVGIGIIDCRVEGLPTKLIRDHHRGALRIKDSVVGVIQPGFIHNIDELRYLVFQDSKVEKIAGPVTTQEALTLSHRELHTWNGLLIDNVTIDSIASNAFNLTHKVDEEEVVVRNSKVGEIGSGALIVSGDININITDNIFYNLNDKAFKVGEVLQLVFQGNTMYSWGPNALQDIQCPSNTFFDDNRMAQVTGSSAPSLLFHPSCGSPQVEIVEVSTTEMTSSEAATAPSNSNATVVVLVLLTLVVVSVGVAGGVWWWWREKAVWAVARGDTPLCEDQDLPDTSSAVVNVCHMNKPEPIVVMRR